MTQYIVKNNTLNSWFMQSVSSDINTVYKFREWIAGDNPQYEYVVADMQEREIMIQNQTFVDALNGLITINQQVSLITPLNEVEVRVSL